MNKSIVCRPAIALLAAAWFNAAVAADEADRIQVLATLPVTYGLGSMLLADSDVELIRAAPESLPASRQPSYFSGRMADVMADDLARLAPADQQQIDTNLALFKQRLLQLSAESESRLAQLNNITVVSLTSDDDYLLSGLNLDVVQIPVPEDGNWTSEQLVERSTQLSAYDVAGVVVDREPDAALGGAIAAAGSRVILLPESEGSPIDVLSATIDQLINALAEDPAA